MSQTKFETFRKEPSIFWNVAVRLALLAVTALFLPQIFIADVNHYWDMGRNVGINSLPYKDFLWEFPPLTTVALLLVPLSFREHWVFFAFFVVLMVLFEVLAWRVVRGYTKPEARPMTSWYWLLVMVPLSSIAYFRLDWPAAFFGAVAMGGLLASSLRPTVWGIVGGFAIKAWTIVLVVPLIGAKRFVHAAVSSVVCAVVVAGWYLFSPAGLQQFLEYRKGSAFQIESIPGSLVMLLTDKPSFFKYGAVMVSDEGWTWLQPVMPAIFVVACALCVLCMWFRPVNVVALTGALILLLLLTSRLLSPQYLTWLAPFVVPLAMQHRRQAAVFAAAVFFTLVEIHAYGPVSDGNDLASAVVVLRNLLLIFVLADLFAIAFKTGSRKQDSDMWLPKTDSAVRV